MYRILIVDDEEWICSVLQDFFEELGYKVDVALNLASARKILSESELPHLLLLDVMLPDGNGVEFLSELRAVPRTQTLPTIIISAHATQIQDKIRGFDKGADGYMTKPFDLRELRARVESMLRRSDFDKPSGQEAA